MKILFTISLLITISSNILITAGLLTNYAIQFDYYSNVLCENKDEKDNSCNGMCHLSSELNFQNADSKHHLATQFNCSLIPLFFDDLTTTKLNKQNTQIIQSTLGINVLKMQPKEVYHPPETI